MSPARGEFPLEALQEVTRYSTQDLQERDAELASFAPHHLALGFNTVDFNHQLEVLPQGRDDICNLMRAPASVTSRIRAGYRCVMASDRDEATFQDAMPRLPTFAGLTNRCARVGP